MDHGKTGSKFKKKNRIWPFTNYTTPTRSEIKIEQFSFKPVEKPILQFINRYQRQILQVIFLEK